MKFKPLANRSLTFLIIARATNLQLNYLTGFYRNNS